jgi:hypothetical protein
VLSENAAAAMAVDQVVMGNVQSVCELTYKRVKSHVASAWRPISSWHGSLRVYVVG